MSVPFNFPRWPPFFASKYRNEHKMNNFQDIKFIFVAKCMF